MVHQNRDSRKKLSDGLQPSLFPAARGKMTSSYAKCRRGWTAQGKRSLWHRVMTAAEAGLLVLCLTGCGTMMEAVQQIQESSSGSSSRESRTEEEISSLVPVPDREIPDYIPGDQIETWDYDSVPVTSEILQGDWIAWTEDASGEPVVCYLTFYQDEEGNDRVIYYYGPSMDNVFAHLEGECIISTQPSGWITEDMTTLAMELVGGAAMENGLPPEWEGEDPSYYLTGVYTIRYYPDLDAIEVGRQFNHPLLTGMIGHSIVFGHIYS